MNSCIYVLVPGNPTDGALASPYPNLIGSVFETTTKCHSDRAAGVAGRVLIPAFATKVVTQMTSCPSTMLAPIHLAKKLFNSRLHWGINTVLVPYTGGLCQPTNRSLDLITLVKGDSIITHGKVKKYSGRASSPGLFHFGRTKTCPRKRPNVLSKRDPEVKGTLCHQIRHHRQN